MGFRRNTQVASAWTQWVAAHRDELLHCGMPDAIISDENRWRHFREHGFDAESDWSVDHLSAAEQRLLRSLLIREYGDEAARHCLGPLET
jgi:hypothetical protein